MPTKISPLKFKNKLKKYLSEGYPQKQALAMTYSHFRKNPEEKKVFLFCYGSNNPAQLKSRLGRSVKTYPAFLENYQRVYRGNSSKWGGGVASLIKKPGHTTYGLVAEITSDEIKTMDQYEGYPRVYSRQILKVDIDGKKAGAIVYISNSNKQNFPSKEYLKAIYKTVSTYWQVNSINDFYNDY